MSYSINKILALSMQDCKHARHSHTAIFQVPKPGVQNSDFMLECFKIQEGSVQCVNFKTIPFATHDFRSHVVDCTLAKARAWWSTYPTLSDTKAGWNSGDRCLTAATRLDMHSSALCQSKAGLHLSWLPYIWHKGKAFRQTWSEDGANLCKSSAALSIQLLCGAKVNQFEIALPMAKSRGIWSHCL